MTPTSKIAKICIQVSPSIFFLFCLKKKKKTLEMQCCNMKFNENLYDTVFSFILPFLCQTKAFFYLSKRGNTNCALDVLLQSVLRKSEVLSEQKLKTERGKIRHEKEMHLLQITSVYGHSNTVWQGIGMLCISFANFTVSLDLPLLFLGLLFSVCRPSTTRKGLVTPATELSSLSHLRHSS